MLRDVDNTHQQLLFCVVLGICSIACAQQYPNRLPTAGTIPFISCTNVGEVAQNEHVCYSLPLTYSGGWCALNDANMRKYSAPCGQGNGACTCNSVGDVCTCDDCGTTGITFNGPGQYGWLLSAADGKVITSGTIYDSGKCTMSRPDTRLFYLQSFLIGSSSGAEADVFVPLFSQNQNEDEVKLSAATVGPNNFNDGFERSRPNGYSLNDVPSYNWYTANLYYSVVILDCEDSSSSNQSLVYDGTMPKVVPEFRVGVGVALNGTNNIKGLTFVDPLAAVTFQQSSLLAMTEARGVINFTQEIANLTRVMYVSSTTAPLKIYFSRSAFSGTISMALNGKSMTRTALAQVPSLVMSTVFPVRLSDTLSGSYKIEESVTTAQARAAMQTLDYAGTFPRSFSFSVSQSRKVSTNILHKSWNVFVAGDQNRSTCFATSPMATVARQPQRNILLPFSIFRDSSEKIAVLNRVGGMAPYFFELVYPVGIDILPNAAKVIRWSDGSFDVFPLPNDDSVSFGTSLGPLSPDPSSTNPFRVLSQYYNSSAKLVSYQRVTDDEYISVLFFPGQQGVVFFGLNTDGQFGPDINSRYPRSGATIDLGFRVQSVSIGESHIIYTSTDMELFFSGRSSNASFSQVCVDGPPSNSSTPSFPPSKVNLTSTSLYATLRRKANVTLKLIAAEAGYFFTVLVLEINNTQVNGTVSRVVVGCGAPYISGNVSGNATIISPPTSQLVYRTLSVGRFHYCSLSDGTRSSNTSSEYANMTASCAGFIDVDSSGVAQRNFSLNEKLWGSRFTMVGVDSISCGQHHVVLTAREGNLANPASSLFSSFQSVFTSGSNAAGQLGCGMLSRYSLADYVSNPRFPFPERLYSARAPNEYMASNLELSSTDKDSNYQLFETVRAVAIQRNTYVFSRSRVFNNPNFFMKNYSVAARSRPSDGKYSLTSIFADAVPEWQPWNPTTVYTNATLNVSELVYDVRFGVLRGLALFLVQNQTSATGAVPTVGNQTEKDCSLSSTEGFTSFANPSTGTFYRDWRLLRRTVQVVTNQYKVGLNSTHFIVENITTVNIPSVFFVGSDGTVFPMSNLSKCGIGSWCDESSKTVVCNWAQGSIGGYSNLIGTSQRWIATFVSVESVNVSTTALWTNESLNASVATLSTLESQLIQSIGSIKYANRNTLWYCEPKKNVYDCSSLVFFQSFLPQRKSPSSFFATASNGLMFEERPLSGGSGYVRLWTTRNRKLLEDMCIFLKLGRFYYYIALRPSTGSIEVCGYNGLSRFTNSMSMSQSSSATPRSRSLVPFVTTNSPFAPATSAPTPGPASIMPKTFVYRTYSTNSPLDSLVLYTIDYKNNLVARMRYSNGTPNFLLDPNNVTLVVGSHGAMAFGWNGEREATAYMLFANSSVESLLKEQAGASPSAGVMSSADQFFMSPIGTLGIYTLPIVPSVPAFNTLALWVRSSQYLAAGVDSVVFRLQNTASSLGAVLQFSISSNGITAEYADDSIRFISASRPFFWSICAVATSTEEATALALANPGSFYCIPRPFQVGVWVRILVQRIPQTSLIRVFLDNALGAVCKDNGQFASFFSSIRGIEIQMRNRQNQMLGSIDVRDIAFCQDNIGYGVSNSNNPFPCAVNLRPLAKVHQSFSTSVSVTVTLTETQSLSISPTPSSSVSSNFTSRTSSLSQSQSLSDELSKSDSITWSFSASNVSTTHTPRLTNTHSKSRTPIKNISLVCLNPDFASTTAYNIRRVGVAISLLLVQDEFSPTANWLTAPSAYFWCRSDLSMIQNPTGFCASFLKLGFATGLRDSNNRSQLLLTFGPVVWYNSYEDESVTIGCLPSASASQFPVAGEVSFVVQGGGYRVTNNLRLVEASGALFALAGMVVGGPASNLLKIATNSIFMNFHCFNDEAYPLSWLMNPTNAVVYGSNKLGVAVVTVSIYVAIFALHTAIVIAVYFIKKDTLLKAQGDVYFPGLSIGLTVILLPGYISGSWQGALESGISGFVFLVAFSMVIVALIPTVFLIHTLYDAVNFAAKFKPYDPEVWQSFQKHFPLLCHFVPPGDWKSTDRHYSFVRRFYHVIFEYREAMQHWFVVEFGEAIFVGSISAISNSSPVACNAQLVCFVVLKVIMCVCLLKYRPYSAPASLWPSFIVCSLQFLCLMLLLIDATKGGTKAYDLIITVVLFVNAMLLSLHSLICSIMVAHFRYLKWKERRLMKDVADQYSGSPNALVSRQPAAVENSIATFSPETIAIAVSQFPNETRYLPDGTFARITQAPIRLLLEERSPSFSDGDSEMQKMSSNVSFASRRSASDDERPETDGSRLSKEKAKRGFNDESSRNFWKIAAFESLTGEPIIGIQDDESTML